MLQLLTLTVECGKWDALAPIGELCAYRQPSDGERWIARSRRLAIRWGYEIARLTLDYINSGRFSPLRFLNFSPSNSGKSHLAAKLQALSQRDWFACFESATRQPSSSTRSIIDWLTNRQTDRLTDRQEKLSSNFIQTNWHWMNASMIEELTDRQTNRQVERWVQRQGAKRLKQNGIWQDLVSQLKWAQCFCISL